MNIEQFYDKGLAHLSYAIISEGKMALIDPGRDTGIYYEHAEKNNANIVAVIETHPHADFISSHAELNKNGIPIYTSKLAGVSYPHEPFDEGQQISLGKITLKAINTPGHSPDSITVIAQNESGENYAIFTGDTLFIGDVGRPDLREGSGSLSAKKEALAREMYHSLRNKIMPLEDKVIVYPAHGAGSLCGKSMSQELSSSLGKQKVENYALQDMKEADFVTLLLENQPTIPKYFPYGVELNRKGAPSLKESLEKVRKIATASEIKANSLIVDTRPEKEFKAGHLTGAVNIQNGEKFETWLGTVVNPEEKFFLIAGDEDTLKEVLHKAAKIGYELNIEGTLTKNDFVQKKDAKLDLNEFRNSQQNYTIVDIRESSEVEEGKYFEKSINIPLAQLKERIDEIPDGKSVVVHCAGGYRSAIGASILSASRNERVFDLGDDIKKFNMLKF